MLRIVSVLARRASSAHGVGFAIQAFGPSQSHPPLALPSRTYAVAAHNVGQTLSSGTSSAEAEAGDEAPVTLDFGRLTLRDYQAECVQECLQTLASGGASRIGVSSPTGSGKTTMFSALLSALPNRRVPGSATRQGSQVLVVVSSIALATQTARAISHAFPDLHVELEQGTDYHSTGLADVTVATAQTLSRSPGRLEKFNPDNFKGIIVDEAHHAAAPSYVTILSHFDPQVGVPLQQRINPDSVQSNRLPIIGFSATFARHDGIALGKVFQRIVYHKDFLEMVNANWLAPVRFTTVRTSLDLSSIPTSSKSHDFRTSALGEAMNTRALNQVIVRTWLDRAGGDKNQASTSSDTTRDEEQPQRRSTLIFAVNVAHVMDLTQAFRDAGIDARYVHGAQRPSFRESVIREFRDGIFPVLVNCAVLTEGADIPPIDCLILARPTRSRNVFMQMLGRGLRLSPDTGKKDCLVLDIVGATERGVICTPTLFGLDISDIIENESMDELRARAEDAAALLNESTADEGGVLAEDGSPNPLRLPRKVTYIDYDSPEALQAAMLGNASHLGYGSPLASARSGDDEAGQPSTDQLSPSSEPYIPVEKLSSNAWVDCGQGNLILEIPPGEGYVKIRKIGSDTGDEPEPHPDTRTDETSKWVAYHYPRNLAIAELDAGSKSIFSQRKGGAAFLLRPRLILHASTLDAAVRGTDTFVERSILRGAMTRVALCRRRAEWRTKKATDPQRELIRKKLGYHKLAVAADDSSSSSKVGDGAAHASAIAATTPDPLMNLTKGQASLILTRLKHGAKSRWVAAARAHNRQIKGEERLLKQAEVQSEKARKRLERLEEKEREIERRRTGDVKVGDL